MGIINKGVSIVDIIAYIRNGVSYKSAEVISKLYRLYVRPHIEYCIQFWPPINVKDADMLKVVQRRATKMIPSLRKLSYEERLKSLSMFSLRSKKLRGDRIEIFTMIYCNDKVNQEKLFYIDEDGRTRKQFMFKNKKACKFKYRIEVCHLKSRHM